MIEKYRLKLIIAALCATPIVATSEVSVDEVSVTATRIERKTQDVPEAIVVIDEQRIEQVPMFNLSEAIRGTPGVLMDSNNGAYDARLIIRGAGLKANYGIREISVLRDGIPITDPDSFTRLDFIDTQDIDQIEITKGPGNLYSAGSAGGTIQILSRSVFDDSANNVKLGAGSYGSGNLHLRYAGEITDNQAMSFTGSLRNKDNNWRRNNEFDTQMASIKHGMLFGGDNAWETELNISSADMQIPGPMDEAMFEEFKATGEQNETSSAFKNTGRYSDTVALSTKFDKQLGSGTIKPKFYFNEYEQYHPVTGQIVVTPGSQVFGTDIEYSMPNLAGKSGKLVTGVTLRRDSNNNDQRYAYRDTVTIPFGPQAGRIIETLSDEKGALLETSDTVSDQAGLYALQSLRPGKKWMVDIGGRIDHITYSQNTNEIGRYDYATGQYVTGIGEYSIDRSFNLFSPKIGATYQINSMLNLFGSLAQAQQVPFSSELKQNPDLEPSTSRNIETGLKGRSGKWAMDTSIYYNEVSDEIVATLVNSETTFSNAGKTIKKGFEFAGSYEIVNGLRGGLNYAYSRYNYDSFNTVVSGIPVDYSGNQLPFIPEQQYSLYLDYKMPQGFSARIQGDTWGEYYLDNANTEKYEGYEFLTSLYLGYERRQHKLSLNVDNLFDLRYATEVKKDTRGTKEYDAGAPRSINVSYRLMF